MKARTSDRPKTGHSNRQDTGTRCRRLIVNADDFGRSASINAAVIQAHQEGILTTASLMVNEPAFEEAVALARKNPSLGVGLHLTLLCGHAALGPDAIPGLVDAKGAFTSNPFLAGWRYFFRRDLRPQLQAEIQAQFDRFAATGLPLEHVNGHLHLHLHPVIFNLLLAGAGRWGIKAMRLTDDPFRLNARLASGRWFYRTSHWLIYHLLSRRAAAQLRSRAIKHTSVVFGLLQDGAVDEAYLDALLPCLPAGDSELYSHPDLDQFKHEFDALVSPRVRARIDELDIKLIRYQDL